MLFRNRLMCRYLKNGIDWSGILDGRALNCKSSPFSPVRCLWDTVACGVISETGGKFRVTFNWGQGSEGRSKVLIHGKWQIGNWEKDFSSLKGF